eukprot:scaffold80899_cov55-Phaeocystis_antarctica.AAC.3
MVSHTTPRTQHGVRGRWTGWITPVGPGPRPAGSATHSLTHLQDQPEDGPAGVADRVEGFAALGALDELGGGVARADDHARGDRLGNERVGLQRAEVGGPRRAGVEHRRAAAAERGPDEVQSSGGVERDGARQERHRDRGEECENHRQR